MKTFTSLLFSVIIAASLSLAQRTNAQECTVNVSGCPPKYLTACADTYQNSILGANINFTPPSFSVSCYSNYAFVMSFDLPESLSGANCWSYNKVQRVGTGGGELRLFQSTGTGDPYFQSPAFFMLGSTNCDMTVFRSSGELFDCNVYLVNGSGTISSTPAATLHIDATHPNNTLKDYLFTVDPSTVGWPNGVYNLLFKFTALNSVSNKNLVTLLQINAVLYGSGCSGDVNFAVTSTGAPGFYPVGSTPVTYSATYKNSSGVVVSSQQCQFNVVVNNVALSNISTTNTTCSGNNGSITFTATAANTSVNNMQYSLDGGAFTALTGTTSNTTTTTNTANGTTTTTSTVVTTTLSNLSAGSHALIVKDAVTNCASPSQSITISSTPDSQNPVVTCKVNTTQTVDANTGATYVKSGTDWDATATDNCGTPTLTYSLSNATTGTGSTLNGVTFNEGTTTVTWTATDGTGNHSSCSFDVVVNASADLSIVKTVESAQVVAGQELKYKIVVSNPTGPSYARNVVISDAVTAFTSPTYSTDDVTYSPWTGSYNVPGTIAKNASVTIYIKGTLPVTQCSGVSNTATVTSDNDTNTANNSSTVASTVLDKTAPTASNPAPITGLKCKGDVPAPDITVVTDEADNCTGSPTVEWVKDENNGGAGCPDDPYIVTRTYSVTDASGNSINVTQTITVIDDVKPVVQTTAGSLDHTLQCSNSTGITAALAEAPTATDNCTATPTIHLVSDVTTPDANCANAYVRVRTWNFTDGCGNTSENFVQTITVIDNTAPVVQTAASSLNHTLQCSNTSGITAALAEAPTATDNGTANPTIHLVSDVTTPDANCANAYVRVRTWNFTDGCGNTSENFAQTITVIDNTAPVVQTAAGSLNHTLQCSDASAIAAALAQAPTATDNCTATPTIHLVSDVTTPDANCANAYVRVRTWNFTDGCGNTSESFVQTITVIDNTAPVVQTAAGSLNHTLQCSDASAIAAALAQAPTATDNCTATPTIHLVSDVTTPDANCANAYVRVRTWNFTDGCGNTSENFVQTITVIDNTAPVVQTAAGSLNHTLQCSDASAIAAALAQAPTATDNCTATPTIHLVSDVTTPDANCANAYVRVRTWNFTDGCGNTSENFVQTITVIDNTAPVVQTAAGSLNHTLQCSDASAIAAALAQAPTATDNCTATPTIHLVSDVTTPDANCANAYVRVRTWNFTDGCGNTSENFVQTITVIDNTAPTWSTSAGTLNRTIQCSDASALATAQALVPVATDNCTTTLIPVKTSGAFVPGSCPQAGTYTNTWVVSDGCGNTSNTFTQVITIIDTQAPTLTAPADITIYKDAQCHFDATPAVTGNPTNVTDNCDPNPVVNHVDNTGFTYNDAQGNVNHGNGYSFPFAIRGMDGLTAADIKSVMLDISTNQELSSLEFTLISPSGQGIILVGPYCATCNPGNTGNYKPTFYPASSGYPKWNNSNLITDRNGNYTPSDGTPFANPTPPELTAGYISKFEDFTGPMNGTWTLFGIKDGTSSGHGAFKSITLIPKLCEDSEIIIRSWSATDACGNVSSRYDQVVKVLDNTAPVWTSQSGALDVTLECSDATGLATAQAMRPTASDNCDQTLFVKKTSGAFVPGTCPQKGTYTNTFTVADTCGNQVAVPFVQVITIKDTTAPVLSEAPANITVECNAVPTAATLTATDNCDANPVVTFNEVRTDGNCPNNYTLTRTWTATDACGNSASKTQIITVQDTSAPVLSEAPANITVESNAVPEAATLTATDNCDAAPVVTFQEVRSDGSCPNSYILTRTWTATDACGNSSSKTQTITVVDTTAPVLSEAPANVTVECNAIPEAAVLTATDYNAASVPVTFNEVRTDGNCPSNYILTRTWTATDACGNSASKTQVITVQDTSVPVLSEAPANVTVECNAVPEPATLTATDNCDVNPTVTYTEVRTDGNCPSNYILTRTWTATDACSNSASKMQVITVQDTSAPMLSEAPANVTVECNAVPEPATLTASDNCDVNPTVTFNEVRTDGNCPSNYILTRTWTATDACGNSASKTQVITVQDTSAPVLSEAPANVTVECNAVPEPATLTASDNCDLNPTVTFNEVRTDGNCPSNYILTRTWTATDACGNSASKMQVITVQDTSAPVLSEAPANVTVECNAVPEPATLTASDNCDVNPTVTFNEVRTDGNCLSNYILTRTWTATDACGNSASKTQVITVQDTSAPVLSEAPANVTVECNAVPEPATLTATDNCDVNPTVTFNEVRTDGNCPSNYILTRTWTATDACGNSASKTQVITVQDTSAPVLSEAPANVTVECNAVPEPATLTATDNCDVNPTVAFNEVRTDGNCPSNYILTRTWTATDACGNSASKTQVIKVADTTPPTLICPPSLTQFTNQDKGFATVTVGQPTVTDNCGNVTYSNDYTNTMNASGQYPIGTTTVTWTATDACGNVTTCAQTITVKDNQNPVFTKCWSGESVSVKTASGVHTYTIMGTDWDATAIDNDAIASLTYVITGATSGSGSTLNNVSLNVGVTHIKWTAVDKSENVSICEYDITVIYGNVPPTAVDDIVTTPEDVTATGNVLTNDSDPDTGNILSVTGFVWNGTSYLPEASVTSQSGTLTLNANGTFSFAPALHYYGSVPAVTYTISDGVGGTASAQLLITVNHVNHSPVARPDAYTTPEGTPISGNVLTNDSDIDGDQVTVKSIAISEKQYTTPASVSISNTGNLAVTANGNFTFTPVASFYGDIPTVIYTATDGQASAAATLNIKVSPIPPIAVDDNASVIQNSSVTINVLANDNYGPAGPGTASLITTNAAHGTVTVDNGGTPTNQADDRIVYMPALGYTGSDSFTYTITGSNNLTATATVTISVRPYTDILQFNKRSTVPVDNGDGTVSWKYTLSITNKLPNANDAITAIHITDDLSRVILSPMTFEVIGKTATGNLKVNGLFDGVSHTDLLLDGSSVAGNSKDSITIELRATLNGFYGYIYNQAVMDGSTSATGTISNVLSDDPSNTEASFPRPTRTFMPEILIIPDVITPNQDGHNDRFVIIHSYRLKISMEIFNRWGNKVYENNDYQNDWDGKGSGHLLGKDLPSGTYYYIIVTRNTETGKEQKYAHYLTLKR